MIKARALARLWNTGPEDQHWEHVSKVSGDMVFASGSAPQLLPTALKSGWAHVDGPIGAMPAPALLKAPVAPTRRPNCDARFPKKIVSLGEAFPGAREAIALDRHDRKAPDGTRASFLRLVQEAADDWWDVEALLDLCFAPRREALSSYRLRDGVAPVAALCLVARDENGLLTGAIRNWPVRVEGPTGKRGALLLGPVAVHPTRQGEGLGAALILRTLELAAEGGWSRVLLVGDLPYYQRFGFRKLENVEMPPPTNPERVLGIDLRKGGWSGLTGRVVRPSAEGDITPE